MKKQGLFSHVCQSFCLFSATSRPDTIANFADVISVNNSVNRFLPDITTPYRPRWSPP